MRLVVHACLAVTTFGLGACMYGDNASSRVFFDENRNGMFDLGEVGVADVMVFRGGEADRSSADGYFGVGGDDNDIVWARPPAGYRPGPIWTHPVDGVAHVPLQLATHATAPVRFIAAADSHAYTGDEALAQLDLTGAFAQSTEDASVAFITVLGDLTQGNSDAQFAKVNTALEATDGVPWVPVPGNHDCYDSGDAYLRHYGPDQYSFEVDNTRFVVWNTNRTDEEQLEFWRRQVRDLTPSQRLVAMGHHSPSDDMAAALVDLGVDHFLTGHWHSNRVLDRGGVPEWSVGPFAMGGIDATAASYRVITLEQDQLTADYRLTRGGQRATIDVVLPGQGGCVSASTATPLSIRGHGIADATWTLTLDDETLVDQVPLDAPSDGMWALPAMTGSHTLRVVARTADRTVETSVMVLACDAQPSPRGLATPLMQAWASTVPGVPNGTAVDAQRLVVSTWEPNGRSFVVAFSHDGAEQWRAAVPSTKTAPVLTGDTVLSAGGSGELTALTASTGAPQWTVRLGEDLPTPARGVWNSPTIDDGVAYLSMPGRLAAVRIADGSVVFAHTLEVDDVFWLGSTAGTVIAGTTVIGVFARHQGIVALNALDGTPRWQLPDTEAHAITASVTVDDARVLLVAADGTVALLDVATGTKLWQRAIVPGGFDWGYAIEVTPVVWGDLVVLPNQWGNVIGLDLATGNQRWSRPVAPGIANFAHYRGDHLGFGSAPLVAGDLLWLAEPSQLVALDRAGALVWSMPLEGPVGNLAVAGDRLITTTLSGVVRALGTTP